MDRNTWKTTYPTSPSRQKTSIFAKVIAGRRAQPEQPGMTSMMMSMAGKTIEVVKEGKVYNGEGYYWLPEWLDFDNVDLYVKNVKTGMAAGKNKTCFVKSMAQNIGKLLPFHKRTLSGETLYKHGLFYYVPEWLSVEEEADSGTFIVKNIPVGTEVTLKVTTEVFTMAKSKLAGQAIQLRKCHCGCGFLKIADHSYPAQYFAPEWVVKYNPGQDNGPIMKNYVQWENLS
jgi:hypothetical protein